MDFYILISQYIDEWYKFKMNIILYLKTFPPELYEKTYFNDTDKITRSFDMT